jgi:hypothetical protein
MSRRMCVKLLVEHCYNSSKGNDHKNARDDIKEVGIKPDLYAEETEMGTNLPVAPTTLSKAEREKNSVCFCMI